MHGDYFQVRRLIWDDIRAHVRTSEADELRRAIGIGLLDENQELKRELRVLVEILADFQQQNDQIREVLIDRQQNRPPEPPGRALLIDKLKLLASDLRTRQRDRVTLQSPHEQELLAYVLTSDADSETRSTGWSWEPSTPRMIDLGSSSPGGISSQAILLRPGTSSSRRPGTATSQRPVSRGSTASISSSCTIMELPELQQRLNVDEIDSIKDDVQEALLREKQELLEDIEFIQGCIDMEQELLDDDRRKVAAIKPPPSLQELQAFRVTLEKTLEDEEEYERVAAIFQVPKETTPALYLRRPSKLTCPSTPPGSIGLTPRPPARGESHRSRHSKSDVDDSPTIAERSQGSTKVLNIRHVIQENRDEPFLT